MTADVNLVSLIDRWSDEDTCREYLEALRWPSGVACLRCGDTSVSRVHDRGQYDCNSCRYQFSVTAGTIMHGSHLPLRKWFLAIYLMLESKKGMSANQLKRTLGVSYKTAWYLCHRIREAMADNPFQGPTLFGIVEVDETWLGGKRHGKGKGYVKNKVLIAGAVQRGGNIRLERIADTSRPSIHGFINKHVRDETEAIYTDELRSYLGIGDENTRHETVTHGDKEWVLGDVHTNSVEGVWSLLKRSIMGAFHQVSHKHLDRYLEEIEWRYNNRENPHIFRDTMLKILDTDTLTYQELTA